VSDEAAAPSGRVALFAGGKTAPHAAEESSKMKSHHQVPDVFTPRCAAALLRITEEVATVCRESAIREGMILVSAMHIPPASFINDDEPGPARDIERWVQKLAPGPAADDSSAGPTTSTTTAARTTATRTSRTAHRPPVIVPVTAGKLDLGRGSRSSTSSSMTTRAGDKRHRDQRRCGD
jgi:thiamine phosphate synthase YjbQ (UPF0047 family)